MLYSNFYPNSIFCNNRRQEVKTVVFAAVINLYCKQWHLLLSEMRYCIILYFATDKGERRWELTSIKKG